MLGENHSLIVEFPKFQTIIKQLLIEDNVFADYAAKYDALDTEIRELELNGAPIDDGSMHQKKHDRSVLKDRLYKQILAKK